METKKMQCTLGTYDIPIIQLQPQFNVDLLESNIAVFGTAMSGKSTLVKTLVNILHKKYTEEQEQIFVLDFGGALSELANMPLVSAYFDNSNEEYVKRVFKILQSILQKNQEILLGKNYRDVQDNELIHTTFIIENINAFEDEPRYSSYQEKFAKLCREGISKGITTIFTAADTKGVTKYLSSFKQKISFEMPFDKYSEIFGAKVNAISNSPGHGYANVTVKPDCVVGTFKMNLPYEIQCAMPYRNNPIEIRQNEDNLRNKFGYVNHQYTRTVKKYRTFPKELNRAVYEELLQFGDNCFEEEQYQVNVGLDYVEFQPVGVDLRKSHVIGIYGKKEFGKTNLLNLLVSQFIEKNSDVQFVFLDDGRKQLRSIYELVKQRTDAVMFGEYEEVKLQLVDGETVERKLSPLQQFYALINEKYLTLDKRFLAGIYGLSKELSREFNQIPDCKQERQKFTVFIIQSKLVYLNMLENRYFINSILPQLAAMAEESGFCLIFSDIQKITDTEQNACLNNYLSSVFLLDNIAEFASERGQRTIFGSMDCKSLKEDFAKCELGDGYYYDIEGDVLKKLKFICCREV